MAAVIEQVGAVAKERRGFVRGPLAELAVAAEVVFEHLSEGRAQSPLGFIRPAKKRRTGDLRLVDVFFPGFPPSD